MIRHGMCPRYSIKQQSLLACLWVGCINLLYEKIFRIFVRQFFCLLARLCVLRHKPFVIGVTGSFGKTTVRHVITEILRRAGRDVYSPEWNYNGEWWLAFSVLQVRSGWHSFRAWVIAFLQEYGHWYVRDIPYTRARIWCRSYWWNGYTDTDSRARYSSLYKAFTESYRMIW